MKIAVIVDVPEDKHIIDPSTPFDTEVKLDYGDTILYLHGEIKKPDE